MRNVNRGSHFHRRLLPLFWIVTLATLISAMMLTGQAKKRIYLVSGVASSNTFPIGTPFSVISIDEVHHSVVKVLDIGGVSEVLADRDRKLILFSKFPDQLAVLDMRSPAKPKILPYIGPTFFCTPTTALVNVACVDLYNSDRRLLGMDLSGAAAGERRNLPLDSFKSARFDGRWSPFDTGHGTFLSFKNGKLLFHSVGEETDFGISLPLNTEPFANAQEILLDVSNDEMVVLDCYHRPSSNSAELHELQIYDRRLGTWQSPNLNAGQSVRGFGPWIATASWVRKRPVGVSVSKEERTKEAKSPGVENRQRILNPTSANEQMSLDEYYEHDAIQYTGDLGLFNIRSKDRYKIRTGQGDSEILLVDGNLVYYRVNDSLFKVSVGGQQKVVTGTKVVNSPDVQLAHWAFLGS